MLRGLDVGLEAVLASVALVTGPIDADRAGGGREDADSRAPRKLRTVEEA